MFPNIKNKDFICQIVKIQLKNVYGIGHRFKLKLIAKKFFPKYKGQFFSPKVFDGVEA